MRALIRAALILVAATTVFAACTSFTVVQPSTTSTSSASGTGGGSGGTGGTGGTGGGAHTCTMPSPATDNEPNDTPETATCLSFEQPLPPTYLNPADKDVDYYTFQGTKGEAILILAAPPTPDRYILTLLDANKTAIAADVRNAARGCYYDFSGPGVGLSCTSELNNFPWSNKNIIETVLPETGTYYVRFSDCFAQKKCPGFSPPDPSVLYSLELHRIAALDASSHKFDFETSGTVTDKTNGSAKIGNTVSVTEFANDNQNNYAASVFYGEFNTTTDTDFFKFNMPPEPQYKDGYIAEFRPVPAGPNGDGSNSPVGSLAVVDASGSKTLALADLSVGDSPELRVLLQAGTDYYLRVRQPAGTVAGNNFYFVYYYPEAPDAVELNDVTNSVIDTPEDSKYSIWGNLSPGDDDYYTIPVTQGSVVFMVCSGQRMGSGLRGLTISAFAGSAGHAPIMGTATPDSALDGAKFFVAATPAGETSVIVKISATSSDSTISGNYYWCVRF
jgi:hypothetical protein